MSHSDGPDVNRFPNLDIPAHDLAAILQRQRQAFLNEGPPAAQVRINRIDRLLALVLDNADCIVETLDADFGTRP